MQIIVVGCGKVGRTLVSQLSKERHNITVIDTNAQVVRDVSTIYDVMGITGNGTSYNVLCEADLEHTDMVIAVTESDEVNLLVCVIAKQKTDCYTIARVRNPVYSEESSFLRSELHLSMTINPELEAAREMAHLMQYPSAIEIDSFAGDRISLMRFKVPADCSIIGIPLKEMSARFHYNLLICIAQRGNDIVIPNGDFVPAAGDVLTVILEPLDANSFFRKICVPTNRVKNCTIIGGSGETNIWGGGAGADLMIGGSGRTAYWYGKGDGHDTIENAKDEDILYLYNDIDTTLFDCSSGDLVITTADPGDTLTIKDWRSHGPRTLRTASLRDWTIVPMQNGRVFAQPK